MHYYRHNIGDYRRDTSHLSLLEHGVYRQLLDMYYLENGNIPSETQWDMRRLGARTEQEKSAVESVLNDFFSMGDRLIQKRCDEELIGYQQHAINSVANGKLGGRPKKTQRVSKQNLDEPNNPLTHEPTNPLTQRNTRGSAAPDGFAEFWAAYPNRTAKPAALRAFKAQRVNGELSNILQDIASKSQTDDWTKDGGKYVPNPATYLNQRRWEDESNRPEFDQFAGAI